MGRREKGGERAGLFKRKPLRVALEVALQLHESIGGMRTRSANEKRQGESKRSDSYLFIEHFPRCHLCPY